MFVLMNRKTCLRAAGIIGKKKVEGRGERDNASINRGIYEKGRSVGNRIEGNQQTLGGKVKRERRKGRGTNRDEEMTTVMRR